MSGASARALGPASKPGLVRILCAVVEYVAEAGEEMTAIVSNWEREPQGTYAMPTLRDLHTRTKHGTRTKVQYSTLTTGKVLLPKK